MIKVFTKKNCSNCKTAKRMFKMYSVDIVEVNVEEDKEAFNYVKNELGLTSLPVVVADGFEPFAYNKDKILQVIQGENK